MRISVIIPTYNAATTITRAVDSVLAQSRSVDEILVIDDGSTDNTCEVVRRYGDAVRYLFQPNTGISGAMNHGMAEAKGDWIVVLAADDEWLPNFVNCHTALLAKNPEAHWTYCHQEAVMPDGIRPVAIPRAVRSEIESTGSLGYFAGELAGFHFGACGFMIRRTVFDEAGNYNLSMRNGQDWDMWGRIALRYPRVPVCPEAGWRYYRDNPNSLHRRGRGCRDVQLESVCRTMRLATRLGPEVAGRYSLYAKMLTMLYLMQAAARDCLIKPDIMDDAKRLCALTVRERGLLKALRLLPKPIATRIADRLIFLLNTRFRYLVMSSEGFDQPPC